MHSSLYPVIRIEQLRRTIQILEESGTYQDSMTLIEGA